MLIPETKAAHLVLIIFALYYIQKSEINLCSLVLLYISLLFYLLLIHLLFIIVIILQILKWFYNHCSLTLK